MQRKKTRGRVLNGSLLSGRGFRDPWPRHRVWVGVDVDAAAQPVATRTRSASAADQTQRFTGPL